MATLELYGTPSCPYTRSCASGWSGRGATFRNMTSRPIPKRAPACALSTAAVRTVPVLVEDGKVIQVGWQGRGCVLRPE